MFCDMQLLVGKLVTIFVATVSLSFKLGGTERHGCLFNFTSIREGHPRCRS